jgi:hypothetical protein
MKLRKRETPNAKRRTPNIERMLIGRWAFGVLLE